MMEWVATNWGEELADAKRLDPAVVPHLESIRAAYEALMAIPVPVTPLSFIIHERRGLWAQRAAGKAMRLTQVDGD